MNNYPMIKKIEQKYGHPYFRMGLAYLFGKGHENVPEIDIEKAREQFEEADRKLKEENEKGGTRLISMMTVDFQVRLIECAKELANIPMWDLFAYIKDELSIDGCIEVWRVFETVEEMQVFRESYNRNCFTNDVNNYMDKLAEICGLMPEDEEESEEE